MPRALKAYWVVTAAIIPGQEIKELTKVWQYTSEDFEADQTSHGEGWVPPRPESNFTRMRREANEYALSLQNPSRVNVVNLQFTWV